MRNYEIVVIGGGPAGVTLSKMLGKKYKMAVIRPENYSMIYCALPYAIEGLIENEKTFKSDSLVTDAGVDLIRDKVAKIKSDKTLELENGEPISFKKLIIATGTIPFIPPIPGSELGGVSGFKTEDDLLWIQEKISNEVNDAVVVGAGAIGIELSQALAFKGMNVHLVDMADSLLPNMIDKEMALELQYEMSNKGVNFVPNSRVVELKGDKFVEEVVMDSGKVIKFPKSKDGKQTGIIVFAVGTKPVIPTIEGMDIEIGKDGFIINGKMETNVEDIFAVGDCAQFHSGIDGKVLSGKLATNAVPMAKILGFNLLGQNREYRGFYNGAATKVGKYYIGGTGFSEKTAIQRGFEVVCGYSEVTTKFPIMPTKKKKKMKLIVDKNTHRVLGAQIVSGEPVVGRVDLLTYSIQKESTVEELTELSYASQPHQSFYPAANLVVLASEDVLKKIKS
jgi:NADPH-dependent 2,4-dienoyl-CoA reductase/sulfur reductase-like enzyme